MSDRPRPRAFRLDDESVALDDVRAPVAPKAEVRLESQPIPVDTRAAPIDEGERQIEEAQRSGIAKPGARRSARLPGRVSAAWSRSASDFG